MTPVNMATQFAMEQLVTEHAWLIGHGQADRVATLYIEDSQLLGVGPDKLGRPAIQAWAAERAAITQRRSRHVQSDVRLTAISPEECRGTVQLALYRHGGPGPAELWALMAAEYEDI